MEIKEVFNKISNKLRDDQRLNLSGCNKILSKTKIKDWTTYCQYSLEGYRRNLVIRDDILDCYLLCWLPGQSTKFHYHPSRGCLYKILEGELVEIRGDENSDHISTKLTSQETQYIHNNVGGHLMSNTSNKPTISLHFYSPSKYYD